MKKMQNLVKEAFRILELLKKCYSCSLKPNDIICIERDSDDEDYEKEIEEVYVAWEENPLYFEGYGFEERKQIALFTVAISNFGVSWNPEKEESVVIEARESLYKHILENNSYIAMMTEAFRIKDELIGSKDDRERKKVIKVKLTKNRVEPVYEYEWDDSYDNSRSYWDYLERSRQYGDDFLPPPPSYTLQEREAIADMVVALCDCDCECDSKITYKTCNDVVTISLGSDEHEGYGSYFYSY